MNLNCFSCMGYNQWSFCTIRVLLRERSIAMDLGFQSNPPVHLVGLREPTLLISSWWPSGHQNWHKDLQWLTSEWDFPIINGPTFTMGQADRYKVCPYWMFADTRGIQSQIYYQKLMRFFLSDLFFYLPLGQLWTIFEGTQHFVQILT